MELQSTVYHIPALLEECIDGLAIKPGGTYVDVTFGGGGHSRAILGHLGEAGRLFSLDQDEDARRNSLDDCRFTFVHSNFRYLKNFMRYYGVEQVDGILADLGVSFHHFDDSERGFSFRFEGPLDMRMNQRALQTAAQVVATYSEEQLADLFFLYGELKSARRIASAIVSARAASPTVENSSNCGAPASGSRGSACMEALASLTRRWPVKAPSAQARPMRTSLG